MPTLTKNRPEQKAAERLDLVAVFRKVGQQHAGQEGAESDIGCRPVPSARRYDHDQQGRGRELGAEPPSTPGGQRPQRVAATDDDSRRWSDHARGRRRRRTSVFRCDLQPRAWDQGEDRRRDVWNSRIAKQAIDAGRTACLLGNGCSRSIAAVEDDARPRPMTNAVRQSRNGRVRHGNADRKRRGTGHLQAAMAEHRAAHNIPATVPMPITNISVPSSGRLRVVLLPIRRSPDGPISAPAPRYPRTAPASNLGQRHDDDSGEQQHDRVLEEAMIVTGAQQVAGELSRGTFRPRRTSY